MISQEYREAIAETLDILEHTQETDVNKIPKSFINFLGKAEDVFLMKLEVLIKKRRFLLCGRFLFLIIVIKHLLKWLSKKEVRGRIIEQMQQVNLSCGIKLSIYLIRFC